MVETRQTIYKDGWPVFKNNFNERISGQANINGRKQTIFLGPNEYAKEDGLTYTPLDSNREPMFLSHGRYVNREGSEYHEVVSDLTIIPKDSYGNPMYEFFGQFVSPQTSEVFINFQGQNIIDSHGKPMYLVGDMFISEDMTECVYFDQNGFSERISPHDSDGNPMEYVPPVFVSRKTNEYFHRGSMRKFVFPIADNDLLFTDRDFLGEFMSYTRRDPRKIYHSADYDHYVLGQELTCGSMWKDGPKDSRGYNMLKYGDLIFSSDKTEFIFEEKLRPAMDEDGTPYEFVCGAFYDRRRNTLYTSLGAYELKKNPGLNDIYIDPSDFDNEEDVSFFEISYNNAINHGIDALDPDDDPEYRFKRASISEDFLRYYMDYCDRTIKSIKARPVSGPCDKRIYDYNEEMNLDLREKLLARPWDSLHPHEKWFINNNGGLPMDHIDNPNLYNIEFAKTYTYTDKDGTRYERGPSKEQLEAIRSEDEYQDNLSSWSSYSDDDDEECIYHFKDENRYEDLNDDEEEEKDDFDDINFWLTLEYGDDWADKI